MPESTASATGPPPLADTSIPNARPTVEDDDARLARFIDWNDVEGFQREFAAQVGRPAEQHIVRAAALGRAGLLDYLLGNIPTELPARIAAFRAAIRVGQVKTIALLHRSGIDLTAAAARFFDDANRGGGLQAQAPPGSAPNRDGRVVTTNGPIVVGRRTVQVQTKRSAFAL